jgi:hypothetical protein
MDGRCSCNGLVSFESVRQHTEQLANDFAVDAYRNKMRSTMVAGGQDVASIAPHFETRTGKRKWLERTKRDRRGEDSP